jgi:hypothetical protein
LEQLGWDCQPFDSAGETPPTDAVAAIDVGCFAA